MRRYLGIIIALLTLPTAFGQSANPVVEAAKQVAYNGLSAKPRPKTSPTTFKPSGSHPYVDSFLAQLFEKPEERKQIADVVAALIKEYETEMKKRGLTHDASAALAFGVASLSSIGGKAIPDEIFGDLVAQIQATMDTPAVRSATDAQKQELYELSLASVGFTLTMAQAGNDEATLNKIRQVANALLTNLIGVDGTKLSVDGKLVKVSVLPAPAKPSPEAKPVAAATGGLAPEFTFSVPAGWTKDRDWYVWAMRDGSRFQRALVRFPAAIPASGNMGDALRRLWDQHIPAEGKGKHSAIVYRRYSGDRLLTQFICGRFPEKGRNADTAFTLFLVDCKTHWQPVVVALAYEDPESPGVHMSAGFSFPGSMKEAEAIMATLRCPPAKGAPLADMKSLAGEYNFGSGSNMQWENIYTGATSMTYVTYGGSLNLKADGTFTYTYSSAAGRDGLANFRGAKGHGTWAIGGDVLICTYKDYDQGDGYKLKEHRYRIAGLTIFDDGVKVAVLLRDLEKPINMTTIGDTSDWYSTKK